MKKLKIEVFSHYLFDEGMRKMELNDENVEDTNMAFISIIGTDECIKYWIQENDKHFFKDHSNVLNLEFDDIGDDVMYNGHHFRTMTMKQAEESIDFIESIVENGVCEIFLHCRAGMSRSRAFAEFIYRYCKEHDIEVVYEDRAEYATMFNYGVLNRLNHAYWKKHRINGYEDENTDYPNELTDTPIRVINRERNNDASKLNRKRGKF